MKQLNIIVKDVIRAIPIKECKYEEGEETDFVTLYDNQDNPVWSFNLEEYNWACDPETALFYGGTELEVIETINLN